MAATREERTERRFAEILLMEKILIYIKHRFRFLWRIIEWLNAIVFSFFYHSKLRRVLPGVLEEFSKPPFSYRKLIPEDSEILFELIKTQDPSDLEYFKPHGFDIQSIRKQFKNRSFLMMGVFDKEKITGYFFLRFFANRRSFVGRLIDREYRGKGIGQVMNDIMYETTWRMGFRCLSTISQNNIAVMKAHSKNQSMKVIKNLPNNYLLVEFVRGS
jgi:hypothetical protein